MNRESITIYWAGRLFNQAERIWNRLCANELRALGYKVILPQEEVEKLNLPPGPALLDAIAKDCAQKVVDCLVALVNLDGPDADSGTSKEAGIKYENKRWTGRGFAIGVRTDFRGNSEDPETGVNAMFRLLDSIVVYQDLDDDVHKLCQLIDERIMSLVQTSES